MRMGHFFVPQIGFIKLQCGMDKHRSGWHGGEPDSALKIIT
jgi:hypothetical protein